MCGIAGFTSGGDQDAAVAETLRDALASRGPDGGWSVERAGLTLVNTRLAVVDLSESVTYPMSNDAGDRWLLFNGEIYNHRELRGLLEGQGHRFRTRCDAEVVIRGYEEWGLDVFSRLNGMFAIALLDERRSELLLARDPFGIKPLVRTTGLRFGFASDALALVAAGLSCGEVDLEAVEDFVAFHYVLSPRTGLKDVRDIEPGTVVRRARDGTERLLRFASRPLSDEVPADATLDEVDVALRKAVVRQLSADVPVGVFLSGGIDSALIASYACEAGAHPRAFTVSFPGHGDYDEGARSALVARTLGLEHDIERFDMGFREAVEGTARAFDRPFADSSALATLALARRAREHVTVALSGTGGDDLFAGYQRHRVHRLRPFMRPVPQALLRRLERRDPLRGGEHRSRMTYALSRATRLATAGFHTDIDQYLGLIGTATSSAGMRALGSEVRGDGAGERVAQERALRAPSSGSTLRRLQRFDMTTYLDGDLLVKEDRTTMAVGLEGRVPLLDHELAAVAGRLPDAMKISLISGKRALRTLARRRLPSAIHRARKRGFAVPLGGLLAGPWAGEAEAWLRATESTLVDGVAAAELLHDDREHASDVWALTMLASWEQRLREVRIQAVARGLTPGGA
ncbi:MAG: asparagine synthase (glutamine-hydrolyzing) [Thermoleophilaceae bacterium]